MAGGRDDFGLLFFTSSTFDDFALRLEFSLREPSVDNSGVFVRFRDPRLPPTPEILARDRFRKIDSNRAWIAAYSGFEVQIDEQARGNRMVGEPDGLDKHRTGAIYGISTGEQGNSKLQEFDPAKPLEANNWHEYEIIVIGNAYTVRLNGKRTTKFVNVDPGRGRSPKLDPTSGYIGLQAYRDSCVAYRNIRIKRIGNGN